MSTSVPNSDRPEDDPGADEREQVWATTLRAEQAPMVIGAVLLVLLGTFYVFEAHRLRDWSVRMMQRESYLTCVRVTGAIMVLAGIGMLIAMGLGLLDTPSWREGSH